MEYTVAAVARTATGSAAVKRMRRTGQVPGIIYGTGTTRLITVDHDVLHRSLMHEAFHSSVLKLDLDGEPLSVLLREVQSHPVVDQILHVDFQVIAADTLIQMTVPIHYVNAELAPGVKLNHGIFSVIEAELDVHCLPKDLPEHIEVDVSELQLNHSVHLSELVVPPGVSFDALTRGEDPSIATVLAPKVEVEETAISEETDVSQEETETDKTETD